LVALAAARRAWPAYSHRNSPKTFTQHQLFACLVLKNFLKADYRGVAAHLRDAPSLAAAIELERVPHFTTLQKAAKRLLVSPHARRLLDATVQQYLGRRKRVVSSAIDSTGLELTAASSYFVQRRIRVTDAWKKVVYHHYGKLGLVCDTAQHFILAMRVGRGPRPDVDEFRPLLTDALRRVRLSRIAADAGYDSEPNHRFGRDEHQVRTLIPPKHGRPSVKPATGRYRRLMQTRFDLDAYHDRAQVETVVSMLKRRQGAYVRGRSYYSQCRELRLMVLTHNVMILVCVRLFYIAGQND
jgi:Transposase DDE domain